VIAAVLDTNVLASGLAGEARPESTPGELLRRWRAKQFTLVVSEPILAELVRTLTNPYFSSRFSPAEIHDTLARVSAEARIQPITVHVAGVATHPQDDVILATALSARAPYLVTGDKQLRQRGAYSDTRVLSPRQFLSILEQQSDN
jgi:putative PIN family toxin of toxin-antitoxin system